MQSFKDFLKNKEYQPDIRTKSIKWKRDENLLVNEVIFPIKLHASELALLNEIFEFRLQGLRKEREGLIWPHKYSKEFDDVCSTDSMILEKIYKINLFKKQLKLNDMIREIDAMWATGSSAHKRTNDQDWPDLPNGDTDIDE